MARPLNMKLVETAKPIRRGGSRLRTAPSSGSISSSSRAARNLGPCATGTTASREADARPLPSPGLGEAREAASEALRIVSEGQDPTADKITLARLKRQPKPAPDHTFEKVLARFIAAQERKGRRSADETRRILEKDALPRWSGRPIASITAADVVEAVEAIVERGSPVAASRFRAWCSKLFSFAVARSCGPTIPESGRGPVMPEVIQRDRRLDDRRARAGLARGRERSATRSVRPCSSSSSPASAVPRCSRRPGTSST